MSKELFTLGKLYPSDFLKPDEQPRCEPIEMKLLLNENGTAHLSESAPSDMMWGEKYWYRSSLNSTMRGQLKNVVDSILGIFELKDGDVWCDLASNDGYLLSCVPNNLTRIGIDPANDTFKVECERHADLVIQDYFSADVFKKSKFGDKKAKVITTISMFYDIKEQDKFIQDVVEVLDDNGLWVVQMSYTPLMIKQLAFDNICHEHWAYLSLFNIKNLFENNGMQILDCELNNTNAGSFRVYAMKKGADINKFGSPTHRDVCQFRIDSTLEYEKNMGMDSAEVWREFYNRIEESKKQLVDFIKEEKAKGKVIMGYGASTKGNTLLQHFSLDNTLITAIAERSSYKFGLRTVGTNIPIISEDEMRKAKPDYLLVLPYHFINEFIEREQDFLKGGGKFIVSSPKFKVIGY